MKMRFRCAWIGVAAVAAASLTMSEAEARRSYEGSGASSARSCLTAPARNLLSRIESKFGAMQINSTCRPGATIRGTGRVSRHASGNAVDFNAGHRKGAVINWLIANHHSGGTMTYSDSSHIHVDIGPRFVSLAGGRTRVASSRRTTRVAYSTRTTRRVVAIDRSDRWSPEMALGGR